MTAAEFRRSSYCQDGGCVEVAYRPDGRVAVRDAKNTELPARLFPASAWGVFLTAVRDGSWRRP